MIKTLAKQISELLFEHDCVIVPGLGGFITVYKPAHINHHNNTFFPPSKGITFNSALTYNDGILINALAVSQGTDFSKAGSLIDDTVKNIRISLLKGRKIELTEIGYLVINKENNIEFTPTHTINYLGDSFGLTKFSFQPVDRNAGTKRIMARPAVRKTMRWAAVMLPLTALALWTTFNAGSLNEIYNNYASLAPSSNQEVASTVTANNDKDSKSVVSLTDAEKINIEVSNPSVCIKSSVDQGNYLFSQPEALSTSGTTKTISRSATVRPSENSVKEISVSEQNGRFYIIAGAFGLEENAIKLYRQLKSEGYNAELLGQNRRKLHLVSIKSFNNKDLAQQELHKVHNNGYSAAWLLERAN